jgi:cation diffusion facilitator family transporter
MSATPEGVATRPARSAEYRTVVWAGFLANAGLIVVKLVAGLVAHSHAVVADAVHSMSDLVTDVALIVGFRYWSAPADERHPHGHRRIETLVTAAIGVILVLVAVGLGTQAVRGILRPDRHVPGLAALVAALVSIVAKEALYRWTVLRGRSLGSPALVANAWHHRSDALSSIPAALAVLMARIHPIWSFVDPLGAFVVCLLILHAGLRIARPAFEELIDTAAPREVHRAIERLATEVGGVRSAHAIRTRYTGSDLAVDLHIEVDGELTVRDANEIAEQVQQRLLDNGPNVVDCIVKVEPYSPKPPPARGQARA